MHNPLRVTFNVRQINMNSNDTYLSPLEVKKDDESRVFIELLHYNHLDYIDDVLVEHFGFDSYCLSSEAPYIICVYEESKISRFYEIIEQINNHHKSTNELYETL